MEKQTKLLVIEDDSKHAEDVKSVISNNPSIVADYVSTFVEAEKLLREKKYNGILSDVFFPYDETERTGFPKGWDSSIASQCKVILNPEIMRIKKSEYVGREQKEKTEKAAERWFEGYEMHPTGVLMIDLAKKANIPIVFCTDTYHHGYKSEPIHLFFLGKNLIMVDAYAKQDQYFASADKKDWDRALTILQKNIIG